VRSSISGHATAESECQVVDNSRVNGTLQLSKETSPKNGSQNPEVDLKMGDASILKSVATSCKNGDSSEYCPAEMQNSQTRGSSCLTDPDNQETEGTFDIKILAAYTINSSEQNADYLKGLENKCEEGGIGSKLEVCVDVPVGPDSDRLACWDLPGELSEPNCSVDSDIELESIAEWFVNPESGSPEKSSPDVAKDSVARCMKNEQENTGCHCEDLSGESSARKDQALESRGRRILGKRRTVRSPVLMTLVHTYDKSDGVQKLKRFPSQEGVVSEENEKSANSGTGLSVFFDHGEEICGSGLSPMIDPCSANMSKQRRKGSLSRKVAPSGRKRNYADAEAETSGNDNSNLILDVSEFERFVIAGDEVSESFGQREQNYRKDFTKLRRKILSKKKWTESCSGMSLTLGTSSQNQDLSRGVEQFCANFKAMEKIDLQYLVPSSGLKMNLADAESETSGSDDSNLVIDETVAHSSGDSNHGKNAVVGTNDNLNLLAEVSTVYAKTQPQQIDIVEKKMFTETKPQLVRIKNEFPENLQKTGKLSKNPVEYVSRSRTDHCYSNSDSKHVICCDVDQNKPKRPKSNRYRAVSASGGRQLLPEWIEEQVEIGDIPGLEWFDRKRRIVRIPWRHSRSTSWKHNDCLLFERWAIHTCKLCCSLTALSFWYFLVLLSTIQPKT
jgi:hypothetical protein